MSNRASQPASQPTSVPVVGGPWTWSANDIIDLVIARDNDVGRVANHKRAYQARLSEGAKPDSRAPG